MAGRLSSPSPAKRRITWQDYVSVNQYRGFPNVPLVTAKGPIGPPFVRAIRPGIRAPEPSGPPCYTPAGSPPSHDRRGTMLLEESATLAP